MVDAMTTYGPDSFVGRLSCIFQGSTDTTFYILAVYFGSVGIVRTRHAVPCGLLADAAGGHCSYSYLLSFSSAEILSLSLYIIKKIISLYKLIQTRKG